MVSSPLDAQLPLLREALQKVPAVVLHAPPGAGKTTRVPLALLDLLPGDAGRIIMLEPRRIAAVSAARWMAQTLGEEAGETVGYTIRFETRRSAKTRIEVVTEGVLTRRIQSDPSLAGVGLVIFDEFHERSVHADLALALCLDARKALRADLKLLVMSATLDCGPIASLLGNARIITSGGAAFPVVIRYRGDSSEPLSVQVVAAVRTALRDATGDVLVFLPGAREIHSAARALREASDLSDERIEIHSLFGALPFAEQERAILPSPQFRKIVLATNIAETSLTIEGVRVVIDSGLTRDLRSDPATGMNRLVTTSVSRSSAAQRTGRAGRLGPGLCYRLYSEQSYRGFPSFPRPEILSSDLAQFALELALWGVSDPHALSWLDAPPPGAWAEARRLLADLGALDPAGHSTPLGRSMARLPLHPRLSRLLLQAQEQGLVRTGADLAAILSERDLFREDAGNARRTDPDIVARLMTLKQWRLSGNPGLADPAALRTIERTAAQLCRLLNAPPASLQEDADDRAVSRLLITAFPDRICKRRSEGNGRFRHLQGRGVRLAPDSHLAASPYLIALSVDAGEASEGKVHIAAAISEEMLRDASGDRIESIRQVVWNRQEGRVTASVKELLGVLTLRERTFTPEDEESVSVLCDAIRNEPDLIRFGTEARQLQGRVALLRTAFPEEPWPDLSETRLLAKPEEWLLPRLAGIRSAAALARVNVAPALKTLLTHRQQRLLQERTPTSITVPSGSSVKLDYASGEVPVLAVKLQELFGLADTPTIAEGRVSLLLHLLSPARRPVQITQDLQGFWNTTYQEVKRDLRGRYPKHPWPDDPWNAVPTGRAKSRR